MSYSRTVVARDEFKWNLKKKCYLSGAGKDTKPGNLNFVAVITPRIYNLGIKLCFK